MTSGARYHLVTTCLVSSLLKVIFLLILAVLLDFRAGFLNTFFTSTVYSVDWRYKLFLKESFWSFAGFNDSWSSAFCSSSIKLTTLLNTFFFFTRSPPFFLSEEFYLKIALIPTLVSVGVSSPFCSSELFCYIEVDGGSIEFIEQS